MVNESRINENEQLPPLLTTIYIYAQKAVAMPVCHRHC